MGWIDSELALTTLAAMLSPTTLTFSVLALVLGDRPLWTGFWFWIGAFTATLAVGVVAAFVLGNAAASDNPGSPKTWVAVIDVVAGVFFVVWAVRLARRPLNPKQTAAAVERMGRLASAPVIAVIGAGAALANPGAFIPIALKDISELDPSASEYVVQWVFFTVVSLLPLMLALVMLIVARQRTERVLSRVRTWLEAHVMAIAALLVLLVGVSLLRNGIAGLTS